MASRTPILEKLAAIAALEKAPASPDTTRALCAWLADPQNVVVARAAEAIAACRLFAAVPALQAAFMRLINASQPATVDKTCRAKEALVVALDELRLDDPAPYLRGIRHVQFEPVYGGRVDTAGTLRGHCAIALARLRHADAHLALAPLLFDTEVPTRVATIKALAYLGGRASEAMLRMLVAAGEEHPDVLIECFAALLQLDADRSLLFLADCLHAPRRPQVEQAALAIGQSRLDEAVPILRACWETNTDFTLRKPLLFALALTRAEEAFALLLTIMRDADLTTSLLACDALALFGIDRRYRERIAEVVAACHIPRLSDAFTAHFPPAP